MKKPKLFIFVGYPGAGKTTTALIIKEVTNGRHIWVDLERKVRFGGQDFSKKDTEELYRELDLEVETYLKLNEDVIFDTNVNKYKDRQFLREIADRCGAETKLIWLITNRELAKERALKDFMEDNLRVLGSMNDQTFNHIAGKLEEPLASENAIKIDGAKDSKEKIIELLDLA